MTIQIGPFLVLSASAQSLSANQAALPSTDPYGVLTPTTGVGVLGIASGIAGRLIWNTIGSGAAGNVVGFNQEHASASAADRIASSTLLTDLNGGGNRCGIMHAYDGTSQRWRRIA